MTQSTWVPPTWMMHLPPVTKSFPAETDLKGKTLIPFNTSAGAGPGASFDEIKELAPDSTVLDGFSISGGIEGEGPVYVREEDQEPEVRAKISDWLRQIGQK